MFKGTNRLSPLPFPDVASHMKNGVSQLQNKNTMGFCQRWSKWSVSPH